MTLTSDEHIFHYVIWRWAMLSDFFERGTCSVDACAKANTGNSQQSEIKRRSKKGGTKKIGILPELYEEGPSLLDRLRRGNLVLSSLQPSLTAFT